MHYNVFEDQDLKPKKKCLCITKITLNWWCRIIATKMADGIASRLVTSLLVLEVL